MKEQLSGFLEEGVHHFPLRVYFSDTDAGGIVYHSRYLDMAEHARTEWLHLLGIDHAKWLRKQGTVFVIRSLKAEYRAPAFLDDLLTIHSRVKKSGRFSIEVIQEIKRQEETLTVLEVRLGYVAPAAGRPAPIPEEWLARMS
jgi:acyl-CoA thioester hydrolase